MKRRLPGVLVLLALAAPAHATLRWGAVTTLQSSRLTPGSWSQEQSYGPPAAGFSPSAGVGALVSWHGAGPLSFEAEPRLLDQRDRLDYGEMDVLFARAHLWSTLRLTQLSLPVHAVWSPVRALRLMAGPELRYLARATGTPQVRVLSFGGLPIPRTGPNAADAIIFEDPRYTYDVTSRYARWGLGGSLGVGTAWPMGDHEGRLDVRWVRGFSDIDREGPERAWEGVQASLGVLW